MRTMLDVNTPMRDGVQLSANIFLPEGEAAYPAIVLRTPYLKEKVNTDSLYGNQEELTENGYCVVIQDVRGTGMSEGVLLSSGGNEVADGYDTVEWVAQQPWCDGHVGMFGLSYFGFDQLAAAEGNPPHLVTICPFQNSAIHPLSITKANTFGYYHLRWLYGRVMDSLHRSPLADADKERIKTQIAYYEQNWEETVRFLPTRDIPAAQIDGVPLLRDFVNLVDGVEDAAYWRQAHRPIKLSGIDMPMFFLTGWFDGAKDGTFDNYLEIMAHGTRIAREKSRLIVGPWVHGGELSADLDGTDFGAENSGESRHIRLQMKEWFDRWLKKCDDVPDEAPVVVFELGSNRWLKEKEWPPARAVATNWYLDAGADGQAGSLHPTQGPGTAPEEYDYNPDNPVPSNLVDAQGRTLFADPTYLDSREDVLVYLSGPVSTGIEIAGCVHLMLYASTNAKDTDFFARLCDVDEAGRAFPILNGAVRGRFRNGFTPSEMTPGQVYLFDIELGHICMLLQPGHRLKLTITSSCFPAHDRNLNTGERTGWGSRMAVAHQRIYHDAYHPSKLILPVLPT